MAIRVSYDKSADVVYVNFGSDEPIYGETLDDFVTLEIGVWSEHVSGFHICGMEHVRESLPVIVAAIRKREVVSLQKFKKESEECMESFSEDILEQKLAGLEK